jgi:hypothetical protein
MHQSALLINCLQVYLALEAGYTEKVDELCERYSLKGYVNSLGTYTQIYILRNLSNYRAL